MANNINKIKITDSKTDEKRLRDQTKDLIRETKDINELNEKAPEYLTGVAKTAYEALVPVLNGKGWLKETDFPIVEALCTQIQIYREAYENVFGGEKPQGISTGIYKHLQNSAGEIVGVDFTGYRANPAVKALDSATAKIKSLSESLGLTPQGRVAMLNISKNDDSKSTMKDLQSTFGA